MNCPKCHGEIPDISRYCLFCGVKLAEFPQGITEEVEIDWENRVLCSDGNCIGTIENGRCRICGKPANP